MSEKTHFINEPLKASLEAGFKYAYCTCGHADTFPYCDGTHVKKGGKPIKFTLDEPEEVILCRCGRSKELPYCDGSHRDKVKSEA
jgi:CDGSH-type Zn-finger protein